MLIYRPVLLKHYILQLNKAIKRKEIDANTHRITKDYYENQLKLQFDNLNNLKVIAKEYLIILKNQELQLRVEERFRNSNFAKIKPPSMNNIYVNKDPKQDKNELKQLIQFLAKQILEF